MRFVSRLSFLNFIAKVLRTNLKFHRLTKRHWSLAQWVTLYEANKGCIPDILTWMKGFFAKQYKLRNINLMVSLWSRQSFFGLILIIILNISRKKGTYFQLVWTTHSSAAAVAVPMHIDMALWQQSMYTKKCVCVSAAHVVATVKYSTPRFSLYQKTKK